MSRLISFVLILTTLLLSGCLSQEDSDTLDVIPTSDAIYYPSTTEQSTETDKTTTITFGADLSDRPYYESLISSFQSINPGIRVKFVSLDGLGRSGEHLLTSDEWLQQAVSQADTLILKENPDSSIADKYVLDIGPLIAADTSFDNGDFLSGIISTKQERIHLLPSIVHINLLAYNEDLWSSQGLATPNARWAWRELVDALRAIAKQSGERTSTYGMMDVDGGVSIVRQELKQLGIDINGVGQDDLFDDPRLIKAVENAQTLFVSGAFYYPDYNSDSSSTLLIQNQQIGMWRADLLEQSTTNNLPFKVGFIYYPMQPSSLIDAVSQGYVISKGTKYPEASWKWLSFLSSQDSQAAIPTNIGDYPARRSIATLNRVKEQIGSEVDLAINTALEQMSEPTVQLPERGKQSTTTQNFNAIHNVVKTALTNILNKGQDTADALRDAQANYQQQQAQDIETSVATPDTDPIVVATPQPDSPVSEGATPITFGIPGFGMESVVKIAESFNQQNPDISVSVKILKQSGLQRVVSSIATQSDCFAWWGMPSKDEITATLDLQPFINSDTSFSPDDYAPVVLEPFINNGRVIGIPRSLGFEALAYNKEVFERLGIDPPSSKWSFNDFIDAATRLTDSSESSNQIGFLGSNPNGLLFFLNQRGVSVYRGSGIRSLPNFTDSVVTQALHDYISFMRRVAPKQPFTEYTREGGSRDPDLINSGKVSMWLTYSAGTNELNRLSFPAEIGPIPLANYTLSEDNFSIDGFFISAQTNYSDACWRWISYLSKQSVTSVGRFPARISVLKELADLQGQASGVANVAHIYAEALTKSLTQQSKDEVDPQFDFFWLYRAVARGLEGKNLEDELSRAQQFTEQYLECVRAGQPSGQCARLVDSTYEGWRSAEMP